jgi:HEAT repeat protein
LIEMMMQADYDAALPLVRPLLRDNAITVRETALAAISKWQDRVSVSDVRNMAFNDPNPFVRPQAVLTLTKLLGQEALPDLVDLAEDLNVQVRRAVAQSLVEVDYLTPAGKAALIRLANDEDTAAFAQDALAAHDLSAIHPRIVHEASVEVPVPEDIRQETSALLNLLEKWQQALPKLRRNFNLEEISEVDQALSTLIVYLRKIQ